MKFSSMLFGSVLVALLATQVGCSGADAAASPADESIASDLKKGKTVKLAAFARDVGEFQSHMDGGGDGCDFTIDDKAGTVTLTVTEGKTSSTMTVSAKDAITLSEKDSTQIYTVRGVGTLTLISADDAFISTTITSTATKTSSTCEIDF